MKCLIHILSWIIALLSVPLAYSAGHESWKEVESFDARALTDRGQVALRMPDIKWRHAETDHFVIHYERKIFALKVSRMAEFFYTFIGEELQVQQDRVDGKSHIFIFREPDEWQAFIQQARIPLEWSYSLVYGPEMYLQQDVSSTSRSGDVLGHEMTHLVINRYFRRPPPLWLNEGLAEWYEEFAYSAYKGIKKSRAKGFMEMRARLTLEGLLTSRTYPTDPAAVQAFYQTAKFLVGYLLIERPRERFLPFAEDVSAGANPLAAMKKHYGIESIDALREDFESFIR